MREITLVTFTKSLEIMQQLWSNLKIRYELIRVICMH